MSRGRRIVADAFRLSAPAQHQLPGDFGSVVTVAGQFFPAELLPTTCLKQAVEVGFVEEPLAAGVAGVRLEKIGFDLLA